MGLGECVRGLLEQHQVVGAAQRLGVLEVQLELAVRIFVVDLSVGRDPSALLVMINPEFIDRDGKFYLDVTGSSGKYTGPRYISDADLPAQLTNLYANRTIDKIMYLKADESVKYERVQAALEMARKAGVRVVGAIAEQERSTRPERH